jgi:GNAT superfamily N-acetyltransferase
VQAVRTRADRRRFLTLAAGLHRDDPKWTPPLQMDIRRLLGWSRHAFYEFAESQSFLAVRRGRPAGRVTAIVNHEHNRVHDEATGFFGFFECENDRDTSRALFETATGWLAERGISVVRGPANPSMNYSCGLLVAGHGKPATFLMPYNHAFYSDLIEDYGFRQVEDMYAYVGDLTDLPEARRRLDPLFDTASRGKDVVLRPCRLGDTRDVERFVTLYNTALAGLWGSVPLTPGEIRSYAHDLRHLLLPQFALGAEVGGELVGVVLGLPDYNPAIRKSGGRLFPFGILRLLRTKNRFNRLRIICLAVQPRYRKHGISLMLLRQLGENAFRRGVRECEYSYVLESNHRARRALEFGGARIEKTYRMYELA